MSTSAGVVLLAHCSHELTPHCHAWVSAFAISVARSTFRRIDKRQVSFVVRSLGNNLAWRSTPVLYQLPKLTNDPGTHASGCGPLYGSHVQAKYDSLFWSAQVM